MNVLEKDPPHCSSCSAHHQETVNMAIDPVCGMTVDTATARHHDHAGTRYYFCSESCRKKFTAAPQDFLQSKPVDTKTVLTEAIYTCPMHPEVRQKGPGACPICGMALEPVEITSN